MKDFKIRCSAIGKIMGQPKLKAEKEAGELSQTAKSYCEDWLKEQLYGVKKSFDSKYTQKGNETEDNSIDFIGDQLGLGMLLKNEQFFENDFIQGTPDVILSDLIIDAKNSWDCFTFPLFETEIPNKDYYWQGQGYMDIVKKNDYKLCYVLSDTPMHLIRKEAYWYAKNNGYDELDKDVLKIFVDKMTYPNVDNKLKLKTFDFSKNEEDIKKIYEQVIKCRNYIDVLKEKLNEK